MTLDRDKTPDKVQSAGEWLAIIGNGDKCKEALERFELTTEELGKAIDISFDIRRKEEEGDRFDWENDPSVIIQEQPETAVYTNPKGGVVILQRLTAPDGDADQFVYFSTKPALQTVIRSLTKMLEAM